MGNFQPALFPENTVRLSGSQVNDARPNLSGEAPIPQRVNAFSGQLSLLNAVKLRTVALYNSFPRNLQQAPYCLQPKGRGSAANRIHYYGFSLFGGKAQDSLCRRCFFLVQLAQIHHAAICLRRNFFHLFRRHCHQGPGSQSGKTIGTQGSGHRVWYHMYQIFFLPDILKYRCYLLRENSKFPQVLKQSFFSGFTDASGLIFIIHFPAVSLSVFMDYTSFNIPCRYRTIPDLYRAPRRIAARIQPPAVLIRNGST